MRLSLKNIGKIESANVELNGITVLAGENNSGKSTVGKVLFAVVNSLHRNREQVMWARHKNVALPIEHLLHSSGSSGRRRMSEFQYELDGTNALSISVEDEVIIQDISVYKNNKEELMAKLVDFLNKVEPEHTHDIDKALLERVTSRILESLDVTDEDVAQKIIQNLILTEMDGQINNLLAQDTVGRIEFTHNGTPTILCIQDENIIAGEEIINIPSIASHAVYIESPYSSLDSMLRYPPLRNSSLDIYTGSHQAQLQLLLRNAVGFQKNAVSELIDEKKLSRIFAKLEETPTGELRRNNRGRFEHYDKKTNTSYNLSNVSTGIKSFLVIKTLLLGDALNHGDVLILDEPEVHLHPQWQLIFAELLVLIQQELDLRILISTHSTDFLDAIEVFSKKHGIEEKCKYYLTENRGNSAIVSDVTDNVDKIYEKLLDPILVLEEEENSDE